MLPPAPPPRFAAQEGLMLRMLGIAAICLVLGCADASGEGADSPAERLDGDWVRDDDATACLRMLTFKASNRVAVVQRICELNDGTIGAEVHVGTFDADSGSIRIYFEQSSCAGLSSEPDVLSYQVSGAQLTLVMPESLVVYERSRASTGDDGQRGAAATFGCFDEADFFEPRAVQPI